MDIFERPEEADVKRLLAESGLPTADITAEHLLHFFGCGPKGELQGVVGLEIYGTVALLRSLAVTAGKQRTGIGTELVGHAESYARENGIESLYLLTSAAEAFFLRRGYSRIPRENAPGAIEATGEFSGLCPASSTFMVKHLVGNPHFKMRIT